MEGFEAASRSTVSAIRALQEKIRRLEQENTELRSTVSSLQNDLEAAAVRRSDEERTQRASTAQQVRQFQARIQQLEQELVHVNQLRDEAIQQVQSSVSERLSLWSADESRLRSDVERYRDEMMTARSEAEAYARQIATYKRKVETEERGRAEAEFRLQSAVQDACEPLRAQLHGLRAELEARAEESAQWKAQAQQLAEKLQGTLEQLQTVASTPVAKSTSFVLDASGMSLQDVAEARAREVLNASAQVDPPLFEQHAAQLNASVLSHISTRSLPAVAPMSPPRPPARSSNDWVGGVAQERPVADRPRVKHTGLPPSQGVHSKLQTAYLGGPVPFLPPNRGSSRPGDLATMAMDRLRHSNPTATAGQVARTGRSPSPVGSQADMGRSMRSSNLLASIQGSFHQQKVLGAHVVPQSQGTRTASSTHTYHLHSVGMPAVPLTRARVGGGVLEYGKALKPPVPRVLSGRGGQAAGETNLKVQAQLDPTEAALQAAAQALQTALALRHAEKDRVATEVSGNSAKSEPPSGSGKRRPSVVKALRVLQQ